MLALMKISISAFLCLCSKSFPSVLVDKALIYTKFQIVLVHENFSSHFVLSNIHIFYKKLRSGISTEVFVISSTKSFLTFIEQHKKRIHGLIVENK